MGFSKYFEDIEDRFGEDIRDRYDKYLRAIEESHLPEPRERSGEVWALYNDRRFEDYMAFPVKKEIRFRVDSADGCEPAEVGLLPGSAVNLRPKDASDCYTLVSQTPATLKLFLKCGKYRKEHTIHFLETASIDKIPEFATLISALTDNPPAWSTQTFPPFRQELESILARQGVPEQFADGVIEYHLALFFEGQRSSTFGKLLERANELLQCFTAYSDYAAMICGFYLFRINSFEYGALANIHRLPMLKGIFEFFLQPYDIAMTSPREKTRPASARKPDILVPTIDHLMLEALAAVTAGELDFAASRVRDCWKMIEPDFDTQRERRLTFLEGRIHRANGDFKRAASCYERIKYSSQARFREEATAFLLRNCEH